MIKVPSCWLNGQLYMKEVPRSLVASAQRHAEFVEEDFSVSLSKWWQFKVLVEIYSRFKMHLCRCPHSRETIHFPRPTFLSSSALLCLETARITLVTSELAPSVQEEATFQNSIRVYHFWPEPS